jgi:uncharacterized damage-inducible protein DinB
MYHTITEFLDDWLDEAEATGRLLNALTDASLGQRVSSLDRSLGEIAWHLTTSIQEIASRTGLVFSSPGKRSEAPVSAAPIAEGYKAASEAMIAALKEQWTDATLVETRDIYGMSWANRYTLSILVKHLIHHRAQATVLMRQAGLAVPGIYGPARGE